MVRFKLLSCIGLVALIGLVAMPPSVLASDGLFIDNHPLTADQSTPGDALAAILADPYTGDIIALAPASITSGLRSGLTVRKHKHAPSCKMVSVDSAPKGGALLRFT